MTAPTPEGNSCSLEDCYTNIFALTDIAGIKWRKLAIDPIQTNIDPAEDPVLNSYSKCLQEDILCVWRRVAKHSEQRPTDISFGKELWIFWYGDQPTVLQDVLSPYLKEIEYGSWENENVLWYECRTLLFKALHNLIERCLLSKNFIRLGKWFVQPQEPNNSDQSHLSFCFNFFLHGESTVCASIEVKQHPAVTLLSATHLQHVHENPTQVQVILAPYGLNGTLTGVTYRDSDRDTKKYLKEWSSFYPIKIEETKENDFNNLPNLVEVIVAGVRMKYPSCYTLLVDYDDPTQHRPTMMGDAMSNMHQPTCMPPRQPNAHHNLVPNAPLTPPTSPEDALHAGIMGDMGVKLINPQTFAQRPPEAVSDVTALASGIFCSQLADRVNQDSTITAGLNKRTSDMTDDAISGAWDFSEPGSRGSCNCLRLRSQKAKPSSGVQAKGPGTKKGEKALERQQSRLTRTTPFHRRSHVTEEYLNFDADMFMPRVSSSNSGCAPGAGRLQGVSNPQLSQVHSTEAVTNMNSPTTSNGIPSPLDEPHNQPVDSAANIDATMPTLSPQPPLKPGEKDTSKQSASESHANNTMVNGIVNDNVFPKSLMAPKQENVTSPYTWNQQNLENTKANINSWLRSQQEHVEHRGLKRPTLPMVNGDNEVLLTDRLYNFDSVQSWSDYPLKKVRYEKSEHLNGLQDGRSNSNSGQNHKPLMPPMPRLPSSPEDPYEFSDESSITPAAISRGSMRNSSRDDTFRRPSYGKGEDDKDMTRQGGGGGDSFIFPEDRTNIDLGSLTSPPTTPGTQAVGGSLTREVDLIPQVSDLDNMFESDSDNDDPSKLVDNTKATQLPNPPAEVTSIAPAELSVMYPTPPSQENNSPMTSVEAPLEMSVMEAVSINIKTESIIGALTEDLYKDTTCVYKPDSQAKFLSSDKYAPVTLFNAQVSAVSAESTALPEYKPSWTYAMPIIDRHHMVASHYINLPSIENLPSNPSIRMPSSAIEASPATFQNSVGQQRTPMSYELQSPASNASSYLNKTPGSNINHNLGTNNQIPEVNSLVVNIVLSDSVLNLFKDHNFDSCSICVCNMNIRGADSGVYVPDTSGEQQYKCKCGFSAVMNRQYGHNAGLFYEDEVDITGIRDDRLDTRKASLVAINEKDGGDEKKVQDVPQVVLQLLLGQFSVPYPTCTSQSLHQKLAVRSRTYCNNTVNIVQLQDGNEVTYFALDQGRQAMEHCHPNKLDDNVMKSSCLHKWTHLQGMSQIPQSSLESVNVLKSLQPLLQEAIQNRRMTRLWDKLQGPLTWLEFHQLAGRGAVESSEPQPIPSFLVGLDKDATTVSPYALKFWEKNMLEPYGHPRDVAYVVVTPENDFLMGQMRSFFKELSTMYEWSHLGRHRPISDKIRDGILRVGKTTAQKLGEQEVDEWFKHIGDGPLATKLRLYAQACRHHLAPFLAQQTDLKAMFAPSTSSHRVPPHRPLDSGMDNMAGSHDDKDGNQGDGNSHRDLHDDLEDSYESPALVIYLVNPFTYAQDWDDLHRMAMIGLLRCYQEIVPKLPESLQSNIYLQIIPLQSIIDFKDSTAQLQLLKNIAFSVFTSCRWNLTHNIMGRSLTGFGPAAAAEIFNKRMQSTGNGEGRPTSQRLYSPPFILAPVKDKQEQLAESCKDKQEKNTILMCVYCLSEDQRWLLACCTDDRGETVETCTINIEIPDRNRRKKTSARKIGLGKLWDFLLGIVSMTALPARIVIGRFGRIGHGELQGWLGLLSKKNIQRCSRKMRDMCNQCSYQGSNEFPCILSACLTSLEQQPSFSITPECVKIGDKQHSSCQLQTPRDASCSHILVFPTSATAQANTHQMPLDATGMLDLGTSQLEFDVDLSNIQDDFECNDTGFDGLLMDVYNSMTQNPAPGSPPANPGSPGGLLDLGRTSPRMNGMSMANQHSSKFVDPQDEKPNLPEQPLAMGYYISTAQTGPLPRWFWSARPDNELSTVKMFKVALHIDCSSNQDDFMHQQPGSSTHPLDSGLTCDVLRFVLEKYNALSWLTFDPAKNDRQSCLPLHMNVLMQMYHAMNAYI